MESQLTQFKKLAVCLLLCAGSSVQASESNLCAVVELEINQTQILERQGFEAVMTMNNALDHQALNNIHITLHFIDEQGNPVIASSDPAHPNAAFFIQEAHLEGIDDIAGKGHLPPSHQATARWLIVPAMGSGGQMPTGTLYYANASLSYTLNDLREEIAVTPDSVRVQPIPMLTLDYFLPRDVHGDDPRTVGIEPVEPFTVGLRVRNSGHGDARQVNIDTAVTEIVEDAVGQPVNYAITQSFVGDADTSRSLMLELGDLPAQASVTGRWQMETARTARLRGFDMRFSHADQHGRKLSTLVGAIQTHELLKDVLVASPGHDHITDFLAYKGDVLTAFESEGKDIPVVDHSLHARLTEMTSPLSSPQDPPSGTGKEEGDTLDVLMDSGSPAASPMAFDADALNEQARGKDDVDASHDDRTRHDAKETRPVLYTHQLNFPAEVGVTYVRIPDPFKGEKAIVQVLRSDGRLLNPKNVWFSKQFNEDTKVWSYDLHLFDTQSTGEYVLDFSDRAEQPAAPLMRYIPDMVGHEGGILDFYIDAEDINDDPLTLSVSPLPPGATLVEIANGKARFNWPIKPGQMGNYPIIVSASDGERYTNQQVLLAVNPSYDIDGDGMDDEWERKHFMTLDRDGIGDYDDDGIPDFEEFETGSNPTLDNGPHTPTITAPLAGVVLDPKAALAVNNAAYAGSKAITYFFEVFTDAGMTQPFVASGPVEEGEQQTSWQPSGVWTENQHYYWRVRAFNGDVYSTWNYGDFYLNQVNEAPTVPRLNSPLNTTSVDSFMPVLSVMNADDPEGRELTYTFTLYSDEGLTKQVAQSSAIVGHATGGTQWQSTESLLEGADYFWQVTATDPDGAASHSAVSQFTVLKANARPAMPDLIAPRHGDVIALDQAESGYVDIVVSQADDRDGHSVGYAFELDTVPTFTSAAKRGQLIWPQDDGDVAWRVDQLQAGQSYYWRVKAVDDNDAYSDVLNGQFTVEQAQTALRRPVVKNPGHGAWVASTAPVLELQHSELQGLDRLTLLEYEFEVYAEGLSASLVTTSMAAEPTFQVNRALTDRTWYHWRVRSRDENGRYSEWTDKSRFYVDDQLADTAPTLRWLKPHADLEVNVGEPITLAWRDEDPDSSASVDLYYTNYADSIDTPTKGDHFSVSGAGWVEVNAGEQGYYYVLLPEAPASSPPQLSQSPIVKAFQKALLQGKQAADKQESSKEPASSRVLSTASVSQRAQATWRMAAPVAGYYELQTYWPTAEYDYPQTVSYTVTDKDGVTSTVNVQPTEGWVSLGVFNLAEGDLTLQLHDNDSAPVSTHAHQGLHIIADKVRMLPLDSPSQLMVSALNEDDLDSRYQWDTHSLNPGLYKVTAIIKDDAHTVVAQSPATIKVNESAYLLVDDAMVEASLDKTAALDDRVSGFIGHGYHVMSHNVDDPARQSEWRLRIREDGWYALAFRDLPGFDNEALTFGLSSQYVNHTLSAAFSEKEKAGSASWASLGKYWLKAGYYDLTAQLNRPATVAMDAIKVQKVAGASRHALEVDNHSIDFSASGAVDVSQQYAGYQGDDYGLMCPGIEGRAAWDVELHHEGLYEVFTNWSAHQSRASNARYTVYHNAPTVPASTSALLGPASANLYTSLLKNQRQGGGEWQSLGVYHFDAGMATVSVNNDAANGCVVADAVKFVKRDATAIILDNASEAFHAESGSWTNSTQVAGFANADYAYSRWGEAYWQAQIAEAGTYRVEAMWTADDDRSGSVTYTLSNARSQLDSKTVSQKFNGGKWRHLGELTLQPGPLKVSIENDYFWGVVVADAVRLTKVE
ncbi:hypothetical protein L4C36_09140 [Photobacterium japonica]|uniref:golvesin C-terminal-like domain-containing protein n=1 Tax=Photobacterium japonica TaxID=2910235 RepID=UPI003D129C71